MGKESWVKVVAAVQVKVMKVRLKAVKVKVEDFP